MLAVQSLAIVITDPQKTISTGEKCFSAALGRIDIHPSQIIAAASKAKPLKWIVADHSGWQSGENV